MLIPNVGNTQRVRSSGHCNPIWNCFDSDTKMENEEAEKVILTNRCKGHNLDMDLIVVSTFPAFD